MILKIPGLEFNEADHVYKKDGKIIPSVTTILQSAGIIDTTWYEEFHRVRGQYVHQACDLLDKGELLFDALDDHVKPFVESYIKFKEQTGFKPLLCEQIVYNKHYGYAGTLDRTGILNGEHVLIDIKTNNAMKWTALQTAAYVLALHSMTDVYTDKVPFKRFGIALKNSGKLPKLIPYTDPDDSHTFRGCLDVHCWKKAS